MTTQAPVKPVRVSKDYYGLHQDPIQNADKILAVWMIRDPDTTPEEPIRLEIDRSAIQLAGWEPGDAITLDPVGPDPETRTGELIIRKAQPGEFAFLLPEIGPLEICCEHRTGPWDRLHGPNISWPCPKAWTETFFPGWYDPETPELSLQNERFWQLSEIQIQHGQVVLPLDGSELFLYLQRTDPYLPTLDVHLPPGLQHLMGWSGDTRLVLESAAGQDRTAPDDTLTIREARAGEESTLAPAGDKLVVEMGFTWLDRFFPGTRDPFFDSEPIVDLDPAAPEVAGDQEAPPSRGTLVLGYEHLEIGLGRISFLVEKPTVR